MTFPHLGILASLTMSHDDSERPPEDRSSTVSPITACGTSLPESLGAREDTQDTLAGTTVIIGANDDSPILVNNTSSSIDRKEDLIDTVAASHDSSSARTNYIAKLSRFLDEIFPQLYPRVPEEDGLKASRHERLSKGYNSVTLTYGEVSGHGFADILAKIRHVYGGLPEKGGTFYDLGSGTGIPVFVAAAFHHWDRCVGFEILSEVHAISDKALERWNGGLKDAVVVDDSKGGLTEIEFVCGDFTVFDWSDGDVVFANSTCFDDELMGKVSKQAASLKEGAIVVTQTDPIPSPAFEVLEETTMQQAGRTATTCFIQRRLPKPPPALDLA